MKKQMKIFAVALVAVMLLVTLASCSSSFGAIKSNFKKNGYEYVEDGEGNSIFSTYVADLEEGDISVTFHLFKGSRKNDDETKGFLDNVISGIADAIDYCGVIEFASDEDMQKALSEYETFKGLVKDAQNSNLVNGNCVLIPGLNYDKQIEIFNMSK